MATKRTNKVEVEITAVDEASPKIERLEKKIDGLESDEARIIVTANTERLERQLNDAKAKLDGLDGDEASVQARLIGTLEQDLEDAGRLLAQLDGKTGTVRIEANATDALGDLDRVDTKLRDIDGRTATARVDVAGEGGLAAAGKGAIAGLGAAAIADQLLGTADLAIQVAAVADATGATHEQAAKTVGLWKSQGFEVNDLLGLITQVNDALAQQPELRQKLGISDAQDGIDQLVQAVEGLSRLDWAEKATLSSQLLGEEGVLQVGLIKAAYGDLGDAIERTPPITKEEDLERMKEMNRHAAEIRTNFERAKQEIASLVLPAWAQALDNPARAFLPGGRMSPIGGFGLWEQVRDLIVGGGNRMGPSIEDIVAANTGGFYGGAFGAIRAPVGTTSHAPPGGYPRITNIYPPPGSPPITADSLRLYEERNGPR
jgi:hypothetical protein